MNNKHFGSILVSVWLGWLAPSLALAQPVITTQPSDRFVNASATVSFFVFVSGTGPFTYQWRFDGAAMAGATQRIVYLANVQPAQSGYYSVIVSNAAGSVTSQVAELKVFGAAPHSLSGIQAETNGSVNLSFKGETTALFAPYYDLYPLETSTNLVDWAPLMTLQRTNTALDVLSFLDADASQFSQRFYRTPTNALLTPDLQPTGPYPVGTFSMVMIDPSRRNAAGGTNYQFMTTFWYPAVAQAGVLPAIYVERAVALGDSYWNLSMLGVSGARDFGSEVVAFFSHSLSNAPLATYSAKYPVVLYSPGSGGQRREITDMAEDLASWGYVVVGLDASDTLVSVFPDGRVVYGSDGSDQARVQDMQFVLGQLAILNAGDPRLSGRLDLDRIGAIGWSWGGGITEELCVYDPRCKAAVGFEPYPNITVTNLLTQPLNVPYLFFRSDFGPDPDPSWVTPGGRADDRLEVFDQQKTNAYYLKLVSTVHGSFVEYDLINDSASFAAFWGIPMSGQYLASARASQILRAYLLSFFNKFLKGEDDHLLDGPSPAYPEVIQFLSASSSSLPPEYPSAGLVQGSDGSFYGTTAYGGASGDGTVFQVTTNGVLTILLSFNGTNGSHPVAALVQGSDGNFYGTTASGGTNANKGTVYQMTPAGTLTTLVHLNGTNSSYPAAGLVQGSDGNFYGTTVSGGAGGIGTVFQVTPAGGLTTLVSFSKTNGAAPLAAVVQGSDGNFYGTTGYGGNLSLNNGAGYGTVFKMTPPGVLTRLVSFTGANGADPSAGLVQGTNGNFYGTTGYGGNLSYNAGYGFGTVFKMTPAGGLTTLVSFSGKNGSYTVSGLVQGSDGNFYGTTAGGGAGGGGTVFKMTAAGVLTTLVSFHGPDGNSPQAPLVQGSDGNFYGTTTYGGAGGLGTVFRVTPTGALTTLVSF
jgi:uncharacterized repeat protein (TIGR03803 family)